MPTPSKPALVLVEENKSHRTKAEIAQRKEAEESTITGVPMEAWPSLSRKAKKEFKRLKELLGKIKKDDAVYENVINRYCELWDECIEFKKEQKEFLDSKDELEQEYREEETDLKASTYYKLRAKIQDNVLSLDRQIQAKRKMMLDIEKENIMTIASSLRSVPKKVQKDIPESGMAAFMKKRTGGGA
ncbi:MAG: hypothetical protein PHO15_02155 [Eubacteriales bacterium]|nr:hypothetical protein [Eubacteriales bacterium]